MNVLWITSWYPNKLAPFNGDFIKRHAEAVSLYARVHVIHIVRDEKGLVTKDRLVEEFQNGNLKETIVYYYIAARRPRFIEKILSVSKFDQISKQLVDEEMSGTDKPDLLQVYIGMKAGLAGIYAKKKYNINYIVAEQWTGLLYEAKDNFENQSLPIKSKWGQVIRNAATPVAVSSWLAEAIKKRFGVPSCIIIPNVVDTSIFIPVNREPEQKTRFIHISTFDEFKNPELILQAFARFIKKNTNAELKIFTTVTESLLKRIKDLGIEKSVICYAEVPQHELVKHIQQAHALILYSAYETFGCVIIEANACGVPVIGSDIPVMRELITDGQNGILAAPGNVDSLEEAMERYVAMKDSFDRHEIARRTAEKYNYSVIGRQFFNLYQQVIDR